MKAKTRRNFLVYSIVGVITSILSVFFLWLTIDVFHMKTVIASSIVIAGLFLLKFLMYQKTGFTE